MQVKFTSADRLDVQRFCEEEQENEGKDSDQRYSSASYGFFLVWTMVARGKPEQVLVNNGIPARSPSHQTPNSPYVVGGPARIQQDSLVGPGFWRSCSPPFFLIPTSAPRSRGRCSPGEA